MTDYSHLIDPLLIERLLGGATTCRSYRLRDTAELIEEAARRVGRKSHGPVGELTGFAVGKLTWEAGKGMTLKEAWDKANTYLRALNWGTPGKTGAHITAIIDDAITEHRVRVISGDAKLTPVFAALMAPFHGGDPIILQPEPVEPEPLTESTALWPDGSTSETGPDLQNPTETRTADIGPGRLWQLDADGNTIRELPYAGGTITITDHGPDPLDPPADPEGWAEAWKAATKPATTVAGTSSFYKELVDRIIDGASDSRNRTFINEIVASMTPELEELEELIASAVSGDGILIAPEPVMPRQHGRSGFIDDILNGTAAAKRARAATLTAAAQSSWEEGYPRFERVGWKLRIDQNSSETMWIDFAQIVSVELEAGNIIIEHEGEFRLHETQVECPADTLVAARQQIVDLVTAALATQVRDASFDNDDYADAYDSIGNMEARYREVSSELSQAKARANAAENKVDYLVGQLDRIFPTVAMLASAHGGATTVTVDLARLIDRARS